MKKLVIFLFLSLLQSSLMYSQVSVNNTGNPPDNSAMLDVSSTTRGMLVPRMTASERDEIDDPAMGLLIFCIDDKNFYMNCGTTDSPDWSALRSQWATQGEDIYYNEGNVGIGESSPEGKLHVSFPGQWDGIVFTGSGLNDLSVNISGYSGNASTDFAVRIQNSGPNPNIIEISSDGGASWSSPIPIVPDIDMGYGVYANFSNTYGHTYNDLWEWTVNKNYPDVLVIKGINIGIGTNTPNISALVDMTSANKGFLPPRMTFSQRTAITAPAAGLLVFQTDGTSGYYYYTGTNWVGIEGTGAGAISTSTCIDYDGNAYPTFQNGTQVWMAENLRVTHYRNGDAIPNVTNNGAWDALITGAYCWCDNNQASNEKYGPLYNWYAVNDSRGLCPDGWHEPTDAEWTTLTSYLGGTSVAGGKMKSVSALWTSPNADATNNCGFSGLPGGLRSYDGYFGGDGDIGYWWTSTENGYDYAWHRYLYYSLPEVTRIGNYSKGYGFSVRCVRDE